MFALLFVAPILFSIQSVALKMKSLLVPEGKSTQSLFSLCYFAVGAVLATTWAVFGGRFNYQSAYLGLIYGVLFYTFITCYNLAIQRGPLSITCFIASISMIVPVILSVIVYHEQFKILYAVGILLIIASAYLINFSSNHEQRLETKKGWLLLIILTFIANAGIIFLTKVHAHVEDGNTPLFMAIGSIVSVIFSVIPFGVNVYKEGIDGAALSKWFIICAVLVGLTATAGNGMLTIMAKYYDGAVIYPITNGTSLIVTILCSLFMFKEKLEKKVLIGIILGVIAVVLLSL